MVVVPILITTSGENRAEFINNMVAYRVGHGASEIFEYANGYIIIKILIHSRVYEFTHKKLRNLINDIWSNNTIKEAIGKY